VRWPGTEVAYSSTTCTASRPLHLAPSGATISRGSGRAALPLAREGAARVSARSVRRTNYMTEVSTTEILARRSLRRSCGSECVEWAIGMLENNYDSKSLRILAGLAPPLNHFELAELRDRALAEIDPPELQIDDPVVAYLGELAKSALEGRRSLRDVFAEITDLAIELGYPRELQPFYNLHFAAEDLQHRDFQYYWKGATRENIVSIMREEAEKFIAARAV
jgi:hypothetical protein